MLDTFLRAVREAPDDDAPRHLLADWLEEHGGEEERDRAEFIRVQCQLDGMPSSDPRKPILQERESQLHERHRAVWEGSMEGDWIRGLFLLCVRDGGPLDGLLTGSAPWRWIDGLSISAEAWRPWVEQLLRSEGMRWIKHLSLDVPCGDRATAFLAGTEQACNLDSISIGRPRFGPPGWQSLQRSRHLTRLRSLKLSGFDSGPGWLPGLAQTALAPALTQLDLFHTRLGDAGAAAIAAAAPLSQLYRLDLRDNGLTTTGALALAASSHLRRPLDLILGENSIGDEGLAALLEAGLLPGSPGLILFKMGLGAASCRALAACSRCAGLRQLTLSFNKIPAEGAVALADSPFLTGLTLLRLTCNQVGDEGARVLARSPYLRGLNRLVLDHNDIGPAGAVDLATGDLPALTALNLEGNPLGVDGVRDFLAALALPKLRELDLSGTRLGDDGMVVVAGSPALERLRVLYLKDNAITGCGAIALAQSPHIGGLDHLEIWGSPIDQEGATALRNRLGKRVVVGAYGAQRGESLLPP